MNKLAVILVLAFGLPQALCRPIQPNQQRNQQQIDENDTQFETFEGIGTQWGPGPGNSCAIPIPEDGLVVAVSPNSKFYGRPEIAPFYKSTGCGQSRFRVKCIHSFGGDEWGPNPCLNTTAEVVMVDTCPECAPTHLDMGPMVFAAIAEPNSPRLLRLEITPIAGPSP